jgi:MFS family permease
MTRYQWVVFFAAWLGWGFDVFDGLLFNFVAPICVPRLLGIDPVDPRGPARVAATTGAITAALLIGWATGGVLFGLLADRLGRARTLMVTMLTYAIATAACAFATDVWSLAAFRLVASLGIGREWAAGASLVAEVVPERRRVAAGALLYTSAPLGILLAGFVNDLFTKRIAVVARDPDLAWRAVFLAGRAGGLGPPPDPRAGGVGT